MGLDRGANYEEQMKVARLEILSKELKRAIREEVAQISDKDIDAYYTSNIARFEEAEMERLYIPRRRAPPAASDRVSGSDNKPEGSAEPEQMKMAAERFHARAVAGEDFSKLQMEAFRMAGIYSAPPQTTIKIKRTSLPSSQMSVIDLKPGEVSTVFEDASGYVIFRLKTKDTEPLEHARKEIEESLRAQRIQARIHDVEDSANVTLEENYFSPAGSGR
jgi:hypothetical protein